ncbi:FadR family transcriptional regulator [Rhodococcus sp. 1R11]|uniref:FadR/GntR family transcriptional regulator n=1 Tax=Rhodococcus sp. 1R11 TaxID=2559614 RepID=UPI0010717522|nr:FadR/GntR family transcriptional regulator [Rhodococcus sp. 1R11]TFI42476.1 FadR family transcriptional regulator [Rhodococcus sp. 1R11]
MDVWEKLDTPASSLSDRLSQRLMGMISDGSLQPGTKLPGERELAESAGVSRTSVREALRDLEIRGLIIRKQGRGTVVAPALRPDLQAGMLGLMTPGDRALREVMDLRAVIEPPIAERAAQRALSGELGLLLAPLERAEILLAKSTTSIDVLIQLDVEFHLCVAKLAHNPLLSRLLEVANEWMAPSREPTLQTMNRITRSVAAHRQIYEAIRLQDSSGARLSMAAHVQEVMDEIVLMRPHSAD